MIEPHYRPANKLEERMKIKSYHHHKHSNQMEERMKTIPLFALLLLLALPSAIFAQEVKTPGAKVLIEELAFDFGYIPAGSIVSHSYMLQNVGPDSLRILKVQPGCGCTKAPLKKDVVGAGESADVELVYTSNKQGQGAFSKSATVSTNDLTRPNFQLSFKGKSYDHADSLQPLVLSSGEIKWDAVTKSKEAKLVVKNVSASAVTMQLISAPSGYFSVSLPESEIKPGKEKEIKVKFDRSVTEEQFKKSFTFAVNDSANTHYTIPMSLAKSPDMTQVQPEVKKEAAGNH